MFAFVLRRLLLMVPTTVGIALVVFALYHAAPGDPATVMMGVGSGGQLAANTDSEAREDAFRREHGLDRALAVQFLDYLGPFNLGRDGHAWFSSPWTERKTEYFDLPDGERVAEGRVLEIPLPRGTEEATRAAVAEHVATLEDRARGGEAWARAESELAAVGRDVAVPALLTALWRHRLALEERAAEVDRLVGALERVTGEELPPHPARVAAVGPVHELRRWFAWYYAHGGYRVPNSGERPWGGLLALDLGREMQTNTPVVEELGRRLAVTVPLSLVAVFLTYLVAIPLGVFSVRRQGSVADNVVTIVLFVLYSVPSFWAGLMLILVFGATGLDLLPVLGLTSKNYDELGQWERVWDVLLHCILPVVTLAYGGVAYVARQMRAGMLDVIRQDYIRTARAKGLSETVVVYKHALRNSLIPIITLLASILPLLISGSIIVEKVFNVPGMGDYAFDGLLNRDFYIIMATTIFVGVMTQIGILLSDLTYSIVDPRIRHE